MYYWLLLLLLSVDCVHAQSLCQDPRLRSHAFATKTSYDTVRGREVSEQLIPECSVIQHYILSRHGTRYDDSEDIAEMRSIMESLQGRVIRGHEQGRGKLCDTELDALRAWTMRMRESDSMKLAETGWRELKELAQRNKARFPSLLSNTYSAVDFHFRHTQAEDGQRTRDSARAYAEGLFGTYEDIYMEEYPNSADNLLKYYDNCDKYVKEIDDAPRVEQDKFLAGPLMKGVVKRAEEKLGLEPGSLDWDTLDTVLDICSFESGIYGASPWCATFTSHDLQIINYSEDLKYYWTDAYGHEINAKMPCELIVDIIKNFESAMYTGKPLAVHRFAHSSTTNGLVTALGLYEDSVPLRHDNFQPSTPNQWNTSRISPMSANIQMALYACVDGIHRLQTFVNEHPAVLPGCDNQVCILDDVMRTWKEKARTCDLEAICQVSGKNEQGPPSAGTLGIANYRVFFISMFSLILNLLQI